MTAMDRWTVGIDPGLGCTALVLAKNDAAVAALTCSSTKAASPIQYRVHDMGLRVKETIQGWVNLHKITDLKVLIELPFLNRNRGPSFGQLSKVCPACGKKRGEKAVGVTTMMKQMRMLAVYEEVLFQIEGCDIVLGEVNNQTAKKVHTGSGAADKLKMKMASTWQYRPDVTDREHLADAQAIGKVLPAVLVEMQADDRYPTNPRYEDGEIGKGPAWAGPKDSGRKMKEDKRRKGRAGALNNKTSIPFKKKGEY